MGLGINDYSRDMTLFDLGGAQDRNLAYVPVSGSAAPGTEIEIRLSDPDSGAATEWVRVGTVDASGEWQGMVSLGADLNFYHAEARVAGDTAAPVRTTNRVGSADVVAFFGQSELETLISPNYSRMPSPEITQPGRVQITYANASGPITHEVVSNDSPVTASVATMAQFWIDNAPDNRRLHLVDLAEAGTARTQLADDSQTRRNWVDLQEIVDFVRQDGADIGLVLESWYASDAQQAPVWSEVFTPFYTGIHADGTTAEIGDFIDGAGRGDFSLDHILWDTSGQERGIFEEGTTVLGVFGPHRFDIRTEMANGVTTAEGGTEFYMRNLEAAREATRDFVTSEALTGIALPYALPVPLDYENGIWRDGRGVSDISHPSSLSPDGAPRFGLHMINAALFALDLVEYAVPVLDRIRWSETFVEVWSTVGDVTTTRISRGMDPLDDTHAHWTDVLGFELNGVPVERAEIVDGRIRIYPLTGVLSLDDLLTYRTGGATGAVLPTEDWLADSYLDTAIFDAGLIGLEGVAFLPETEGFANTPDLWVASAPGRTAPVPLPASGALAVCGLLAFAALRRQRRPRG